MSKTDYTQVDEAILKAIKAGQDPYLSETVRKVAQPHAVGDKPVYRVIDARLQALRTKGAIEYDQRQWKAVEKAAA